MSNPSEAHPAPVLSQYIESTGVNASAQEAERHPPLYYTLLTLLAGVGYAWTLIFPLGCLLLVAHIPYAAMHATGYLDYSLLLAEFSLAIFLGVISIELYKLHPAQPSGRPLLQHESPILHTMIEELCKKYHLPRITRIRITRDCNISSVITPVNGYPLFHNATLLIGLPLMQSLDARQLLSAIEREIVQLAGRKKRLNSWLCFLRQIWQQHQLAWQKHGHLAGWVMRTFYVWYAPLFGLFSQAACRQEQLYADLRVQRDLRDNTVPDMLMNQAISQRYLDENFWPHLYRKAYRHKHPPYLPYSSLDQNLRAKLDAASAQDWLNAALEMHAQEADVPTLKQRLANLGIAQPVLPASVMQSSARYFLGEQLKLVAQQLDQMWLKTHEVEWQQKYQQGVKEQHRLRELAAQAAINNLGNEQAWELIQLAKKYIGDEHSATLYKQVLRCNLADARIYFDIGRSLLAQHDEEGVNILERAMSLDKSYTVMSCQLLTNYFVRIGNSKSAQNYRRRALAYQVEAA